MTTDAPDYEAPSLRLPDGCYGMQPDKVKAPVCFGVDVKPSRFTCTGGDLIWNADRTMRVIRPIFMGDVDHEDQVLALWRQYRVRFAIVDSRPEATIAIRLQNSAKRYGIDVWRAQYNTAPSRIKIVRNEKERLFTLERTLTLDVVHHRLSTGMGICAPQGYREINHGRFLSEMTASTRVFTKIGQNEGYKWVEHGNDDAFHSMNLLFVAMEASGALAGGLGEGSIFEHGVVESTLNRNVVDPNAPMMPRFPGMGEDESDGGVVLEV